MTVRGVRPSGRVRGGAAFALLLAACGRCGEPPVAELTATIERVERDHIGRVGAWQPAATGTRFAVGEGVRTFERSRAELSLQPGGHLRVEPNTTVRFSDRPQGAPQRLSIERGAVELETHDVVIELRSEGAVARVERGTRVRVRRSTSATRFDVQVGQVQVERDGERRAIGAGAVFELRVGKPLVELEAAPPSAMVSVPADAGAVDAGAAALGTGAFDPSVGRAELTVAAGEHATVHHPAPPARVRVAYAGCPGDVAVEAYRSSASQPEQRVRGRGGALLRLAAGAYRYRVFCIERELPRPEPAAEGTLRVREDRGTQRLSTVAPQATVDADGRRYTVRYQNLLPAITLRWPNAPSAPSYVLQIDPERGTNDSRRQSTARASVSLPAGALSEGAYRFTFQAGSARSPSGSFLIVFDHAGRAAYLSEPADRSFAAGAKTAVAGSVVAGASVSIGGARVAVDHTGRFEAQAAVPAAEDALAVRVQHPSLGIHYYLRRVTSAPQGQ